VAFHCYRGDTSQLAAFHARNPKLPLAISECSGGDWSPRFADNLRYDAQNLLIDGIRNGASWVAKWNVALDPHGGPTNGGCTTCQGLVTIDPVSHTITPTEAYYAFGHLGKFVTPGAQVLASTTYGNHGVDTVAFRNPDGSHVLFLYNEGGSSQPVTVRWRGQAARVQLPAGAIATLRW
jgi:glucosylceramidase